MKSRLPHGAGVLLAVAAGAIIWWLLIYWLVA
jgi:hypothetical protein